MEKDWNLEPQIPEYIEQLALENDKLKIELDKQKGCKEEIEELYERLLQKTVKQYEENIVTLKFTNKVLRERKEWLNYEISNANQNIATLKKEEKNTRRLLNTRLYESSERHGTMFKGRKEEFQNDNTPSSNTDSDGKIIGHQDNDDHRRTYREY